MNGAEAEEARSVTLLRTGALTTVQDCGRPGWAHLGVARSGFLDRASARWANRLVGNAEGAALLETTAAGLALRADVEVLVAVTGARADVHADGRALGQDQAYLLGPGVVLEVGAAREGVRSYVALGGGVDGAPVLGSQATDVLGGIGPAVLADGDVLPLGRPPVRLDRRPAVETVGLLPRNVLGATPAPEVHEVRVVLGPRADWLEDPRLLDGVEFVAGSASNRVGLRLESSSRPLVRRQGELASEPTVLGSVQLPPSGDPVVFLADHPTTGGYPVVAVVLDEDVDLCARVRPGERVRFRLA